MALIGDMDGATARVAWDLAREVNDWNAAEAVLRAVLASRDDARDAARCLRASLWTTGWYIYLDTPRQQWYVPGLAAIDKKHPWLTEAD